MASERRYKALHSFKMAFKPGEMALKWRETGLLVALPSQEAIALLGEIDKSVPRPCVGGQGASIRLYLIRIFTFYSKAV
jgi:hypothetical protein